MSGALPEALQLRLAQVDAWVQADWLRPLDHAFAAFLAREAPDADPLLLLAAALASHQLGRGHVCLDLAATLADATETLAIPPEDAGDTPQAAAVATPADLLAGVRLPRWQAALRHPRLVGDGPGTSPLVLVGARLYLRRYWQHERSVRDAIAQRLALPDTAPDAAPPGLQQALDALFPWQLAGQAEDATDWQKVACALAARSPFGIITGGPGTGKTTTVVKLLAVLQHLALGAGEGAGRRLRIRLAAPTGKAAARLNDSIANAVAGLPLDALGDADALRAAIPTEVTTVHRLLGSLPGTRHFRHHARNPLPVDVLVLDEASMVDLEMMAAVLAALPPQARLVLLGDKDQLASVEAGAVLGELCRRADQGHYLPATRDWLLRVTGESVPATLVDKLGEPLDQAVVKLRRSHRFGNDSGIGRLAHAVNAGDVAAVRQVAASGRADLAFLQFDEGDAALRRLALDGGRDGAAGPVGYRNYLEQLHALQPAPDAGQPAFDRWAAAVLRAFGAFQLLCAVRKGPQGVEQLNQRIASMLHAQGLTGGAHGWYLGRPVMVTRNDYGLGLMNGDVGMTLQLPGPEGWNLRVAFASGDAGGVRWVLPSRLQAVDTVFAMTVHKSQGSEFTHAALMLPQRLSRVLTRELVYTGITRARQWFTLATAAGAGHVLEAAVERRVKRSGGLLD